LDAIVPCDNVKAFAKLSRLHFLESKMKKLQACFSIANTSVLVCLLWSATLHAQPVQFVRGPEGVVAETSISTGSPRGGILNFISADLRGDGRRDLLLGIGSYPPFGKQSLPMRVLRPNTAGTAMIDVTRQLFGQGALPSNEHPREFAIADFNRDGKLDIFVAAHGYDTSPFDGERNTLIYSNADGTYVDRSSLLPTAADFSHCVAVGDVNGDGFVDIYVGNVFGSGQIRPYFLMGKADGFDRVDATLPVSLTSRNNPADVFHVAALADIDGDGALDLVLGTTGYTATAQDNIILLNDGRGDFTKRARVLLPRSPFGATAQAADILPVDVNGDGKIDLLVLTTQSGALVDRGAAIQVLINQGGGVFTDESAARLGASASRTDGFWWTFLRQADINNDGRMDFYASGSGSQGLSVPIMWINKGDGTFTAVSNDVLFKDFNALEVVDVDGDGRLDFVGAFVDGNGAIYYRSYLNRTPPSLSRRGGVDIAGNGKGSIVVRSASKNQLQVGRVENSAFVWTPSSDPGPNYRILGAFDFSGGGKSDLAVLEEVSLNSSGQGSAQYLSNFSVGTAQPLRLVKPAWRVDAVGDMDGDGQADLVWRFTGNSGNIDDTGVSYIWFSGSGGVSQVRKRGGAPLNWTLLGAQDMNGDSAADMVYVSPANAVRVLMATANRTCANLSGGSIPAGFTALRLGSFSGNAGADILLRNSTSGAVRIMSLSAAGLALPPYTGAADDPNASCTSSSLALVQKTVQVGLSTGLDWTYYASADVNGDGLTDVIWRRPDGQLTVWLFQPEGTAPKVIESAGFAPVGFSPIALQ
jgi:hypothetical protein